MSARRVVASAAARRQTLPWDGSRTAWGWSLFTAGETAARFLLLFLGPTKPRDELESGSKVRMGSVGPGFAAHKSFCKPTR